MKPTVVIFGIVIWAGCAFAGSQEIIRQRARNLQNQNNAYQGAPGAGSPQAPAPQQAAAPSTKNLAALQADLAGITAGSSVSEEQKKKISDDIMAGATGSFKPGAPSAAKLAAQLATIFSQKTIPAAARARLIQELDAVLNPEKYPQARLEGIYADIPGSMDTQGVAHRESVLLVEAVKAVAAECRGQKPAA